MDYEKILNQSESVSQEHSRVNCLNDGLRILAKIIARDLVIKSQSGTNRKKGRQENELQVPENG